MVRGPQEIGMVVMVVLPAGAEGRRHRQPVPDVHRVVARIVISARTPPTVVGPVVLHHIHPERENPNAEPNADSEFPVSNEQPQKADAENRRDDHKHGMGDQTERPGFENAVGRQVFIARVGNNAEIHRLPKAIRVQLIGIAGMVGVLVMQPVTIDPTHGIDVNAQRVINESDRLDEPLLVIQSPVRDAQVNNVGKINSGKEPEK